MSRIIENNHVFVIPSPDTWNLFAPYLKSAPFRTVTKETAHTSIIYADSPIAGYKPSSNTYFGRIKGCKVWYNPYMNINDLVVELESEDLTNRHEQIKSDYGVKSFFPDYFPHFTLAYDIPPYSDSYKWFINEMITLCYGRYKGQVVSFGMESIDSTSPADASSQSKQIEKDSWENFQ